MPDIGAKRTKKTEGEQEQNELDKVAGTSKEIEVNRQLPEDSNLTEEEIRAAGKTANGIVDQEVEAGENEGDELRHTDEQIEQQDLNQGMDTGTHDSTRHGVDWGRSYQVTPTQVRKPQKKE